MGSSVLSIVMQLMALFPTLIPAVQGAITAIKDAFDSGQEVTPEQIKAIVDKAIANHAVAVALLKPEDRS